ncbi:MAG: glycoside hydrolase family 15 protein [Pseudomonadota bacterium]
MSQRIEDYGLIGDCEAAALVGRDGSIDWLCWPRFDSDACFAAVLGTPEHGRWLIAPADSKARVTRRYRGDTLILETRFETGDGVACLVDFMPPRGEASDVVRLVVGERGCVEMQMELVLRFGYGAATPWVTSLEGGGLRAVSGPDMVVLRTPAALHGEDLKTVSRFRVSAGDTTPFVLSYAPSHCALPEPVNARRALADTQAWWEAWSGHCTIDSEWRDAVQRSLITLKALTYAPTGGIVAAPTASLPEQLGGARNWDYRYCWLRDATLTLLALMDAGYFEEARAWREWLLRAAAGSPQQMQIMYGIGGERRLQEWQADWLPGYAGSRPVNIGNGAHDQRQLDVYGELMDALHQARRGGLASSESSWGLQRALIEHLESVWTLPDKSIWEVRGPDQHFTYSKMMAWVALDRGIKAVEAYGLQGPHQRWHALRARIHEEICTRAVDPQRGCFVQAYGSKALDASLLLMPQLGFLPPQDARVKATVAAIERELLRDGFVLRYDTAASDDGLPPGEGAFLACSFWLVDAYMLDGRLADARRMFERLLSIRNDLGLLAEEYDPRAHRQVGNFPQAFSHIALVDSALNLSRAERPAQQRSAGT